MGCFSSIYTIFEGSHPGWLGYPPGYWEFPDTANTSSTEDMYLSRGYDPIEYAEWKLVWQPTSENQYARFIWMPTGVGYGVWSEIGSIHGERDQYGWGPRTHRFNCTPFFQQMIANRADIYIGLQVWGDSLSAMMIWKSNLHMVHGDGEEVKGLLGGEVPVS